VAGHPLRPATRRRLGRPSPHQQADRPRAHPTPQKLSPTRPCDQQGIFGIRPSFPGLSQSAGQITHVLLTRSPLVYPRKGLTVRLACVKHAASVRPEPESNSPNKNSSRKHLIQTTSQNWQKTTTPPKREKEKHGKNKNNKQKPPNTLLSSQTTHPQNEQPCHCTPHGQRRQTPSASVKPGPWATWNRLRLLARESQPGFDNRRSPRRRVRFRRPD
jgi:hypothetical protein